MQDYATWRAIYRDGTALTQEQGSYEDIDREQLEAFSLLDHEGYPVITVAFKEGQGKRLIWRRRVVNKDGLDYHFYLVGKKGGFVALLKPNFEVVINDRFDNSVALLSSVKAVKGEE